MVRYGGTCFIQFGCLVVLCLTLREVICFVQGTTG